MKADGWSLLSEGRWDEASTFFEARIKAEPHDFSHYWGQGKALLALKERDEAVQVLELAVSRSKEAWERQEISFDVVETIEKDLDRALGYPRHRVLGRVIEYLYGCLCLVGVAQWDEILQIIENLTRLRAPVYSKELRRLVENDVRFLVDDSQVWLSVVEDPKRVAKTRIALNIHPQLDINEISLRSRSRHVVEWAPELNSILEAATGGNLGAEELTVMVMNAETFQDFLKRIEKRTRIFNLQRFEGKWESFLFELWINSPRWELGGVSLDEARIEDLWLGNVNKSWIAGVLGLSLNEEGDFCCPDCGEKLALLKKHSHR